MFKKPYLLYTAGILIILNNNLVKAAVEEEIQSVNDLTQNFFDSLQNDPRLTGEYCNISFNNACFININRENRW